MSGLWSSDVSLLYADGRLRQLFPTSDMTYPERVNALVRLIVLMTVCIYLYNRDTRYVLYGMFCVGLLTFVAHVGISGRTFQPRAGSASVRPACTHPTVNNPFANVLLTDYKYDPNRPPACPVDSVAGEIEAAYGATAYRDADDLGYRRAGFNQFITQPDTTTWQGGREAFAKAVYGSGPTCKQDQSKCFGR